MSQYRRIYQKGSIVFLTIVTYNRQRIFDHEDNIILLRQVTARVKSEMPFEILGIEKVIFGKDVFGSIISEMKKILKNI
jgi:REP element-mobilizing transposase RayT